jgi:hypothetical protein
VLPSGCERRVTPAPQVFANHEGNGSSRTLPAPPPKSFLTFMSLCSGIPRAEQEWCGETTSS